MILLNTEFYELIEDSMPKAVRKRLKKKSKCKKCIRVDCDRPQADGKRQLCDQHYNQFDYARRLAKRQGVTVLRKFERDEISQGRVGKSNRGKRGTNDYLTN